MYVEQFLMLFQIIVWHLAVLTIGSTDVNYGCDTNWSSNTAGLMMGWDNFSTFNVLELSVDLT